MESEIDVSPDILQPIPLEKWPLLQRLFQVDWPKYADYYYWFQNYIKWKTQDPDLAIEIYRPEGNYQDDTTFVAISSYAMYVVFVFTNERSGEKLHEALVQTNRIDWSQDVVFARIEENIQPIFSSALAVLQANRGIEIQGTIPSCFYIKSAEECANVEIKVPKDCYLGDLNPSHVSLIHLLWPYASKEQPENSLKYIQAMVTLNKSIGLFLKKDNFLVSWALHNDWHGVGVVQTVEAYKRKGYAKVVVNALAKRLGNEGISPILAITRGNTPSENMFTSLNWRPMDPFEWIIMKKRLPNI